MKIGVISLGCAKNLVDTENEHEVIHVSSGKACGIDGKGC